MATKQIYDYPESNYEIVGFYKDVKINGELVGTFPCDEEKGRTWGYHGQMFETTTEKIITSKKKVIPAGTTIHTMYYPICGKLKNKF